MKVSNFKKYKKVAPTNKKVGKVIYWGDNNEYPQYVLETIQSSPLLNSILSGSIDFTLGEEIVSSIASIDVISKCIVDRWYFGGFCLQVLYNDFGDVVDVEYIDIRYCRLSEDGNFVYVYDAQSMHSPAKCVPIFNKETGKDDGIQIYYYVGNKTRDTYPISEFGTSLIFAEIQAKIGEFHYNTLNNNFNVSAIINFNNGNYSEDVKDDIERKLNAKFSGAENAGKFILLFNDSSEQGATVERLSGDDFDSKYQAVQEACENAIFTSLRAMPQLFGLAVSSGFAAIEYDAAFKLYNRTAVIPKQKEVLSVFRNIFGKDTITIKPYSL